jgi:predicted RNA binding protein YcfA (HicA-like mRNA interferase family)
MKVRNVIKKLEIDGWYQARMRGSHRVFKHPTKPGIVVVPGHFSASKRNLIVRSPILLCN